MDGEQRKLLSSRESDIAGPQYFLAESRDNEISLTDLVVNIACEWKSILLVLLVGCLVSLVLAFYLSRDYRVTASLRLPTLSELGGVNDQSLIGIEPVGAFSRFAESIQSPEIHMSTLESGGFLEKLSGERDLSSAEIFSRIDKKFTLHVVAQDHYQLARNEKTPLRHIQLSLQISQPEIFKSYLEQLIETAEREAIDSYSAEVAALKANRIQAVREQLDALSTAEKRNREAKIARLEEANHEKIARLRLEIDLAIQKAARDRQNRIVKLEEAQNTATALNIKEPVTFDDLRPLRKATQVNNEIVSEQKAAPLYFQGTRLLKAELERLTTRQSDKPFVGGLTEMQRKLAEAQNDPQIAALKSRSDDTVHIAKFDELQQKLASLAEQPTHFDNVHFAIITRSPTVSSGPIHSPKLIFLLGILLSGIIALFCALLISSLRNNARQKGARNDMVLQDSAQEGPTREVLPDECTLPSNKPAA